MAGWRQRRVDRGRQRHLDHRLPRGLAAARVLVRAFNVIECRADVDGAAMLRPDRCAGHALEIRQFRQREIDLHRSEEHTSELQSLMRISYAVFCLKKKKNRKPL